MASRIKPLEPTPRDFDAFGGEIDNCIALQKWLDYGGVLRLDANYYSSKPLYYGSHTFIKGIHPALTGIYAHPGMLLTDQLWQNKNASLDLIVDSYIRFENMGTGGQMMDPTIHRDQFCFNAVGALGLEFERFMVRDWAQGAIGLNNCAKFSLNEVTVNRYGSFKPAPTDGSPFDGGNAIWVNWNCVDGRLTKIFLRNGQWSGAELSGHRLTCDDWQIVNVTEAGIFSGPVDSTLNNFKIDGVVGKVMSSHGAETGGWNNHFTNWNVKNVQGVGGYFTTATNCVVSGWVLENCCLSEPEGEETSGNAFLVFRNPPGMWQEGFPKTQLLQVKNNILVPKIGDAKDRKAYAAIRFLNWADNPEKTKFQDVDCRGNIYGGDGDWKSGKACLWEDKDKGDRCYV